MNIAVVGADGRSGRAFIDCAVQAGHTVRAGFMRGSIPASAQVVPMHCDATDADEVSRLVEGADAVVSLIGHVKGSPADVQTNAMQTIIAAMHAHGCPRLISLTGTGVRFPGDRITLVDRLLNWAVTMVDRPRIEDGRRHAVLLQQSRLDWTLIRVLKLMDSRPKPFTLKAHGPTKWYVSRVDVAKAILEVLERGNFVGEAPIIGTFSKK